MGIVPFDDHPSVLLQLRGIEHLEQGLRQPLDQPRLEGPGSADARTTLRERAALTWAVQAQTFGFIVPETKRRIRVCSLSERLTSWAGAGRVFPLSG